MRTIKNLFLILAALVFAGGVLGTSVVRTTAKTVSLADAQLTPSPQAATPSDSGSAKIDYYLPYPGLLPDHFLYPLKAMRDRIWLFLTLDPVKKGELLLLFADKRLGAGKALIEGGKTELGISTLTKGEKYLEQAINQTESAWKAGKKVDRLAENLTKATLKHEEVLKELLARVTEDNKPVIQGILRYSQEGSRRVIQFK